MKRLLLWALIALLFASCSNRGYMQNGCPKGYAPGSKQSEKHWKNVKAYIHIKIPGSRDYCTTITKMK